MTVAPITREDVGECWRSSGNSRVSPPERRWTARFRAERLAKDLATLMKIFGGQHHARREPGRLYELDEKFHRHMSKQALARGCVTTEAVKPQASATSGVHRASP